MVPVAKQIKRFSQWGNQNHDMKPQQDSKQMQELRRKTHRGARRKGQMEKQEADRSREPVGQSLGNIGEKPRELGSRSERKQH